MTAAVLFNFRLFIAGDAVNSSLALANLKALCEVHVPDQYDIEVVDVFREPRRALAEGVIMTPTTVMLSSPMRRVVGTLTNAALVAHAFGLGVA